MAKEKIIKVNSSSNIDEVFPRFVASQTAKGLSDKTIKTYFNHYHSMLFLHQPRVSFNRHLNSLQLNANIPLRIGCRTVLKQSLNKRNIKAIDLVSLCSIPLAEAVATDVL